MKIKDSLRDLRDNIKCANIPIIGVSGEEEKEAGPQKIVGDDSHKLPEIGQGNSHSSPGNAESHTG